MTKTLPLLSTRVAKSQSLCCGMDVAKIVFIICSIHVPVCCVVDKDTCLTVFVNLLNRQFMLQ